MHFNENANREQAITKTGEEQYGVIFPKYKKGGYIIRRVTVDPTYGKHSYLLLTPRTRILSLCAVYIDDLIEETTYQCQQEVCRPVLPEVPEALCSIYERPVKADAVKQHKSRYSTVISV